MSIMRQYCEEILLALWSLGEIAEWFIQKHNEWIENNKLVSWAGKLGINLNSKGKLDEGNLFQLFVLAILWNNKPTYKAEKGEEVFIRIKNEYTLENFKIAAQDNTVEGRLREVASNVIHNPQVYKLLMFIADGKINGKNVWVTIKEILESPVIGNEEYDLRRLKELYGIFNPPRYDWQAYFTVKVFLIFREIRIQFRGTGKYQYHPTICCVPDSNVRKALISLGITNEIKNDLNNMIKASRLTAEAFCTEEYELYDLPLFFWYKEKRKHPLTGDTRMQRTKGKYAGVCPKCGSPLVWRKAKLTNEIYRGCTNFPQCRWNDRSY